MEENIKNIDVDITEFINLNTRCLYLLGYFIPNFDSKEARILYQAYATLLLSFAYILCLLSQFGNMVAALGDVEKMTEASFLLLTNTNQALKIYVFLFRSKEVWNFIQSLNRFEFKPKSQKQTQMLLDDINISQKTTKVFLFMCSVTCCLWGVFPFLDKLPGGKLRLPLSGWYPFSTETSPSFELTFAYQIFATWINGLGNISMDTFISGSIMIIAGQLKILKNSFEEMKLCYEEDIGQKLMVNIIHYKNILSLASEVTSLFTLCIISQFAVSVFIICMNLFQMSLVSPSSLQFFSMLLYQSCILLEIFLWCYYGNEVIVHSDALTNAAYIGDWIEGSKQFKQDLLFFMTRSQFPLKLYAGGYFTLSLTTFMAILKSSWSYFAVLNSVHSEAL